MTRADLDGEITDLLAIVNAVSYRQRLREEMKRMGSAAVAPAVTQQPSMTDKIMLASKEAAAIAEIFAPSAAAAVDAGIAVEPIIISFGQMIVNLFHHHTKPSSK